METKNHYDVSRKVTEISAIYKELARNLVANFNSNTDRKLFIEIDCAPTIGLNAFSIANGLNSARIIFDINNGTGTYYPTQLTRRLDLVDNDSWAPSYNLGENLGLWKRVRENDYEELADWNNPFCIKNTKGVTKIWHPYSRKIFKNGFATRSSIVKFIKEETAYIQPFYSPLPVSSDRLQHSIYRLVFFSNGQDEPEFFGGLVISRQGFKIYPGPGSIVGLLK